MQSRSLTLAIMAVIIMLATPALARFVVMDANFDGRTAGASLGRNGALQGEPVAGPWDREDEEVVSEGAGDMAIRFPDTQILGPSEMYFTMRDDLAPIDGLLTARWTVTPESVNSYQISLRGADLETELMSIVYANSGMIFWSDADEIVNYFFDVYVIGDAIDFLLELNVNAGTYTLYSNGSAVVTDEPHGLGAHEVACLVFAHPEDGNATGALIFDDISLDWRPGTASALLDATFSDKPVGQVIDTRGAFYGEPVRHSGSGPIVEIGPPLGNKAIVFTDTNAGSSEFSTFEFLGGVEPQTQPLSVSFAIQVDQLEDFNIAFHEQGANTQTFLRLKLRESGQAQFFDAASGTVFHHVLTYAPDEPILVELHFEPVFDIYSVWWNGERVIHRRAHGVTGDNLGRINFGFAYDLDLDGILYVDRIRAYTLGTLLAVNDAPTPAAPAILLAAVPNPFNPATEIRFELPSAAPVTLDIFDGRGRLVRRLVDEALPAGLHKPTWRGVDQHGRRVASGVYHARVIAGSYTATTAMTLVK